MRALAGALPSLPALEELSVEVNKGMGAEGAAALVAAIPNCPRLRRLEAEDCGLDEQAEEALQALARPATHPAGELVVLAGQGESDD